MQWKNKSKQIINRASTVIFIVVTTVMIKLLASKIIKQLLKSFLFADFIFAQICNFEPYINVIVLLYVILDLLNRHVYKMQITPFYLQKL